MCLLVTGYHFHHRYPLIVAANRDELYGRPTAAAHWWDDVPGVLGGRDLEAGGTWMGITTTGRFAALTNYWESEQPHRNPPSRGELVREYLSGDEPPERFLEHLERHGNEYNGFNLIFGSPEQLFYYSNRATRYGALQPGIHVLSNHLLNTPWPKAERARRFFSGRALRDQPEPGDLLEMMNDVSEPEAQRDPGTPAAQLRALARHSIRIALPRFGTRASTVLIIDDRGSVRFTERTFDPEATRDFSFHLA
jgi:uncharacterized protein with NRDE domain